MRFYFLISLLFFIASAHAQTRADWWFFGDSAGVHFTANGPVADTNSSIVTPEGCATISDLAGNMLFYTDGISVWDASHQLMPNGTGLLGAPSSTQSAIILPRPGNSDHYYIVTVPVAADTGMRYSLVDMTLNGGLGDVVAGEKNIMIRTNIHEKVCAVQHSNNQDYWIVTQPQFSDSVLAFELTSGGVNLTPVISVTGDSAANVTGYLKPSIQGDLIASVHEYERVQLMKFDASSGQVTNVVSWSQGVSAGYGVEFSASGQVLYAAQRGSGGAGNLVQYDISVFSSTAILASEQILSSNKGTGALQIGPDLKIYMATYGFNPNGLYLSSIDQPNVYGPQANYIDTAVFLEGRNSRLGLPPFLNSVFSPKFDFNQICVNDSTQFNVLATGLDSVFWDFGDPGSAGNQSTDFNPTHLFSDSGKFLVTLVCYQGGNADTTLSTVTILPRETLDLGPDTTLCTEVGLLFDVSQPFATYLWNDGSTDSIAIASSDTTLFVTLTGLCDTLTDQVTVSYDSFVPISLPPDTTLCRPQTFTINPAVGRPMTYEWSDGSNGATLTVSQTDTYTLAASNECGSDTDSVAVTFLPVPFVNLPDDTVNCLGNSVTLFRPQNDSITYTWSDSTSGNQLTVDSIQTVWLRAENECGIVTDTVRVFSYGNIAVFLGVDTQLCPGDTIRLGATVPNATYLWSTGDTTDSIWTNTTNDRYSVTVTLDSCQATDRIDIQFTEVACENIDCRFVYPNVFTPNQDGWNDLFRVQTTCNVSEYRLRIFNRWGQLVHASGNINIGWDGYIRGEPASDGVYYFYIEYADDVVVDADRQIYQASFTLMH